MDHKIKILLYSFIILGLFLTLGNFALALQATPDIDQPLLLDPSGEKEVSRQLGATATEGFFYASERTDIYRSLVLLIRYLISFVGVVFVIVILYGGFVWMTAGGNEENIGKAKKLLRNGAIGVVIIFLSFSFWVFIVENLIQGIAVEDRSQRELEEWEVKCKLWDYECKERYGWDGR